MSSSVVVPVAAEALTEADAAGCGWGVETSSFCEHAAAAKDARRAPESSRTGRAETGSVIYRKCVKRPGVEILKGA